MFTLAELQLIQNVMADPKIGYPFAVAETLASAKVKLIENIADLEQRDARQRAATALRAPTLAVVVTDNAGGTD